MKSFLLGLVSTVLFLGASAAAGVPLMAQCGAEGLDRCCGNPARACAKTGGAQKPTAVSARLNPAAEALIRQRTEMVRLQRERIERARTRRKQMERVNAAETANLFKNLLAYDKKGQTLNLFPVEGFTPGVKQTTYFSLRLDAEECGRIDDAGNTTKCYIVNGYHLYFDGNNVSDHLYVNRFRIGGMPGEWARYGFDWDLSYNEWVKLFKKLGYETVVTQKPEVVTRDAAKFFEAELVTVLKTPQGRMLATLSFTNAMGKTKATDKGTLFSVLIDKIG